MLLHLWSEKEVPADKDQMVTILLSLAKTEIAAAWKSTKAPSISSCFDRIWKSLILSKITERSTTYSSVISLQTGVHQVPSVGVHGGKQHYFLQIYGPISFDILTTLSQLSLTFI